MGEVPAVNKEMAISLLSHLWAGSYISFLHDFFVRAMAHVLFLRLATLSSFVRLLFSFPLASWRARFVRVVLRTPGLRYIVISV